MSYYELSKQAKELRKNKQFADALILYGQLFETCRDNCDEFDWWGYAFCLQKEDKYAETLEISREGLQKYPDSSYLKNTYSWAIYHLHVQPEPVTDRETFFRAAEAIIRFSRPDDKYSPLPITIFSVIDLLELNYDENVNEILNWISNLNPVNLNKMPYSFTSGDGKKIENASDFEKYYAILIKAQQEAGLFTECINNATIALKAIKQFHHGNDVWIRRQRALAYYKTDRFDESLDDFKQVLAKKQDWFLKMELAELYLAMGEFKNSLTAAIDAADDPGVSKMKVNLYLLIAKLFLKLGKSTEAALHAHLVISLRAREGWGDDHEAEEIIDSISELNNLPEDFNTLLKLAEQVWAENLPAAIRTKGVIKIILPNGKSGFIEGDDGEDYYFQTRDVTDKQLNPTAGLKVSFAKTESFDKKKNKPSVKATDIKKA